METTDVDESTSAIVKAKITVEFYEEGTDKYIGGMSSVVDECDSHTFVSAIANMGEQGFAYLERRGQSQAVNIATVECSDNTSNEDWLSAVQHTLRAIGGAA